MVVKLHYDPINRALRLLDSEFRTLLEGDALYDLALPLMFEDGDEEFFPEYSSKRIQPVTSRVNLEDLPACTM